MPTKAYGGVSMLPCQFSSYVSIGLFDHIGSNHLREFQSDFHKGSKTWFYWYNLGALSTGILINATRSTNTRQTENKVQTAFTLSLFFWITWQILILLPIRSIHQLLFFYSVYIAYLSICIVLYNWCNKIPREIGVFSLSGYDIIQDYNYNPQRTKIKCIKANDSAY